MQFDILTRVNRPYRARIYCVNTPSTFDKQTLSLWRPPLSYWYSYKASCASPG